MNARPVVGVNDGTYHIKPSCPLQRNNWHRRSVDLKLESVVGIKGRKARFVHGTGHGFTECSARALVGPKYS